MVTGSHAFYTTATLTLTEDTATGTTPVAEWVLGTVIVTDDNYSGSAPTQHTEEAVNFQFGSITEAVRRAPRRGV